MAFQQDGKIYIKLDPSGEINSGDEKWDDGIGGRIKQIFVWHDDSFISGFQTIYELNGKSLISKRHGGAEGNFEIINPKKPLTWLSGHYGSYCWDPELFGVNEEDDPYSFSKRIFSLKFGNEAETYGPFGLGKNKPFSFHGSNEIVGFHGFSNKYNTNYKYGYISAIGLYIKTEAEGFVGEPSNSETVKVKTETREMHWKAGRIKPNLLSD